MRRDQLWKSGVAVILSIGIVTTMFGCGNKDSASDGTEDSVNTKSAESEEEGTASTSSGKGEDISDKKIAVIVKGMNSAYWQFAAKGSEDAAADYGVTIDILSPTTADNNEQQLQLVEQAVAQQYDVICLAPADSSGIIPGVKEANEAGIPVILYTNSVADDSLEFATYLRVDDHDSQFKTTDYLCQQLQEGKVFILSGVAGQQNSQDKLSGAEDAIAQYPKIEIVASQAANWSSTDGYKVTQNLLQANPDVDAIVACNDQMAAGAMQALEEIGKNDGSVLICGMNADATALQAIKDGKMTNTLDNMPYDLGYLAVERAVELLNGETLKEEEILDTVLVTADNVDEIIEQQESRGLEG